ncbi:MAG: nucleoside deaminase [Candidatus Obscuribacterales bacterium]
MSEKLNRRTILLGACSAGLFSGMAGVLSAAVAAPGARARDEEEPGKKPVELPAGFENLDHDRYMRLAIEQANRVPDCPFGAVIVNGKTKEVVSRGWVRKDKNPTWHGEMTAIFNCPEGADFPWQDMCLYTTGESCPMCQAAIVWTKMPMVVYGSSIPFLQTCGFGQINIRAQKIVDAAIFDYGNCTILGGILEKDCNALFEQAREMATR